jgi:peptide deformylase
MSRRSSNYSNLPLHNGFEDVDIYEDAKKSTSPLETVGQSREHLLRRNLRYAMGLFIWLLCMWYVYRVYWSFEPPTSTVESGVLVENFKKHRSDMLLLTVRPEYPFKECMVTPPETTLDDPYIIALGQHLCLLAQADGALCLSAIHLGLRRHVACIHNTIVVNMQVVGSDKATAMHMVEEALFPKDGFKKVLRRNTVHVKFYNVFDQQEWADDYSGTMAYCAQSITELFQCINTPGTTAE